MKTKSNSTLSYYSASGEAAADAKEFFEDRRRLADRRRRHWFINWRSLGFAGRRQHHRRPNDRTNPRVDWYPSHLLVVVIGIVVLSGCDAFFTLKLLSLGAIELNVLMAQLIEQDIATFVQYKIALTCLSTLLMVIFHHVRLIGPLRVRHLLWIILASYGALIVYELTLLSFLLS